MNRLRSYYEPRPSVYVRTHKVIKNLYREKESPLTFAEIERGLKCTPGIMFADGISLPEVLCTLAIWRMVKINSEKNYIPLDWN